MNQRSRAGLPNFVRGFPATPRGMDTMDILELNRDEDVEYWDEGSEEIDEEEEDEEVEDEIEDVHREKKSARRGRGWRNGRNKRQKDSNNNKNKRPKRNKNKKNKKKGHRKKIPLIPNDRGVKIKPVGGYMLFNLKNDPEEKHDLKLENPEKVAELKEKLNIHFKHLVPKFAPADSLDGHPGKWGGVWGPGWCSP